MPFPEIAVVVSTFERPQHLARCLASLAAQRRVEDRMEVVVTDDGSQDDTADVVDRFAAAAKFPVKFVTQPQQGFRLAKARNNGVRASQAPYLLFTDGDCLFPADHVAHHLAVARRGVVRAGDCLRLEQEVTERLSVEEAATADLWRLAPAAERKRHRRLRWRTYFYQAMRHPRRPKLVGNNIGLSRDDFELVNGFDEAFVGWGCEDNDFAIRLRRAGVRARTILHRTYGVHMWHPPHHTAPAVWSDGANVARLRRRLRLTRCLSGLVPRDVSELSVRIVNDRCRWVHTVWRRGLGRLSTSRCEIEILALPGHGQFSPNTELRVLVATPEAQPSSELAKQADAVLTLPASARSAEALLSQLRAALSDAA